MVEQKIEEKLQQVYLNLEEEKPTKLVSRGHGSNRHIIGAKQLSWSNLGEFADAKPDKIINAAHAINQGRPASHLPLKCDSCPGNLKANRPQEEDEKSLESNGLKFARIDKNARNVDASGSVDLASIHEEE